MLTLKEYLKKQNNKLEYYLAYGWTGFNDEYNPPAWAKKIRKQRRTTPKQQ